MRALHIVRAKHISYIKLNSANETLLPLCFHSLLGAPLFFASLACGMLIENIHAFFLRAHIMRGICVRHDSQRKQCEACGYMCDAYVLIIARHDGVTEQILETFIRVIFIFILNINWTFLEFMNVKNGIFIFLFEINYDF